MIPRSCTMKACLRGLTGGQADGRDGLERGPVKTDLLDVVETLRVETLQRGPRAIARSPRMYLLARTISPSALEAMGTLRFENSLYDFDGRVYFITGQWGIPRPDYTGADVPSRAATSSRSSTIGTPEAAPS
jgi:hypothetical protein